MSKSQYNMLLHQYKSHFLVARWFWKYLSFTWKAWREDPPSGCIPWVLCSNWATFKPISSHALQPCLTPSWSDQGVSHWRKIPSVEGWYAEKNNIKTRHQACKLHIWYWKLFVTVERWLVFLCDVSDLCCIIAAFDSCFLAVSQTDAVCVSTFFVLQLFWRIHNGIQNCF